MFLDTAPEMRQDLISVTTTRKPGEVNKERRLNDKFTKNCC